MADKLNFMLITEREYDYLKEKLSIALLQKKRNVHTPSLIQIPNLVLHWRSGFKQNEWLQDVSRSHI